MDTPMRGMTRNIQKSINANIHNRFDIEVIDAKSGKIRQRAYAENVILNTLWGKINTQYFSYIQYGVGNGTPAATDTGLFSFSGAVAVSTTITHNDDTTNHVYSVKRQITLDETTAVGVTITEVGIAYGNLSSNLLTHAMLKDMNGAQISIAKTNTDIINVYATIFIDYSSMLSVFVYDATKMSNFCLWLAGTSKYLFNNSYGNCNFLPRTGASVYSTSYTATVNSNSKSIQLICTRLPAGAAVSDYNQHGISTISFYLAFYNLGVQVAPIPALLAQNIPALGSNIVGEAIGTGDGATTTFSTYFTNASTATVFVDGVVATGVTVSNSDTYGNNIVFATAPSSGAVITANYHTDIIAKDTNHVLDFDLTFNFGEYTS